MSGYRLRYTGPDQTLTGVRIHLVPMLDKPLYVHHQPVAGKDECPTCRIVHPTKTHHLWLDSQNTVLVSKGVLDDLQRDSQGTGDTGLAKHDLELIGGTDTPPPLTVGDGKPRRQQDQENEKITLWKGNGNG